MIEADLIEGADAAALVERFFANPIVAYIHAHYARRRLLCGADPARRLGETAQLPHRPRFAIRLRRRLYLAQEVTEVAAMHDLVIRGGTVVDGTGADPVVADVAVDGGAIITAVGPELPRGTRGDRRDRQDRHAGLRRHPHAL